MEIQCPFQIVWTKVMQTNVTDWLFQKFVTYGSNLALVDRTSGKNWRFSELRAFTDIGVQRLSEIGVTNLSRLALITSCNAEALFVLFACGTIGVPCIVINGFANVDELWQQVDASEATHCITEETFMTKVEDVRRRGAMRGGSCGRIRVIKLLADVLGDRPISLDLAAGINRKSISSRPDATKQQHRLISRVSESTLPEIDNNNYSQHFDDDEDTLLVSSPLSASGATFTKLDGSESSTGHDDDTDTITTSAVNRQPPFLIIFSNDTTGQPKPVELSHRALMTNLQQASVAYYGPPKLKDRVLLSLGLHNIYGIIVAFYALYNGATLVTMSRYMVDTFLETIQDYKISHLHVIPPMVHMLAADSIVDRYNLASLRSLTCGGAPVDATVIDACRSRLKLNDMRQLYCMCELGGICTWSYVGSSEKLSSVGVPMPGCLLKVVRIDDGKQLCAPMEMGQLCVKGPQVMPRYYKNARATQDLIDFGGYVKTGDAGYYDIDGYLFVVDRIKDIIKFRGTLVCPSEVEAVLRSHPGIDDCAVVGRADNVAGEVPAAFVVKNAAYPLLASAEVRQHVAGKIPQFKELRGGVYFISEVPRSSCGKIMRKHLRQYWDRDRTTIAPVAATKEVAKSTTIINSTDAGNNKVGARTTSRRPSAPATGTINRSLPPSASATGKTINRSLPPPAAASAVTASRRIGRRPMVNNKG